MGRLTKGKIDQISKLREEGYTQKETAEKVKVHLRTVRKYDPLREKPVGATPELVRQVEKSCNELVAKGLFLKDSFGRFRMSSLGERVAVKFEEIKDKAVLGYMAGVARPVTPEEIQTYLDEIGGELLDKAIHEVKRQQNFRP